MKFLMLFFHTKNLLVIHLFMLDMLVRVALHFGLKALRMLTSSMHGCDYPHDFNIAKDHILAQESCLYVCMHDLFHVLRVCPLMPRSEP